MPDPRNTNSGALSGKRILIAAAERTSHKICAMLEARGASVICFQSMEIREFEDKEALERVLPRLAQYAWVIFSSANGVFFFSKYLDDRGIERSVRECLPVCAVGPATAKAAEEHGFRVALVPREFVAEGILAALAERPGGLESLTGRRMLIPRARRARDILPQELERAGALVDVVSCYESVPGKVDERARTLILDGGLDLLVFTSSANLENFAQILGRENAIRILSASPVAVLGPIVALTAESFHKTPEIIPAESSIDALLHAIDRFFRPH
jgi:uroporphyrinogen III methyltransferase/synthase